MGKRSVASKSYSFSLHFWGQVFQLYFNGDFHENGFKLHYCILESGGCRPTLINKFQDCFDWLYGTDAYCGPLPIDEIFWQNEVKKLRDDIWENSLVKNGYKSCTSAALRPRCVAVFRKLKKSLEITMTAVKSSLLYLISEKMPTGWLMVRSMNSVK